MITLSFFKLSIISTCFLCVQFAEYGWNGRSLIHVIRYVAVLYHGLICTNIRRTILAYIKVWHPKCPVLMPMQSKIRSVESFLQVGNDFLWIEYFVCKLQSKAENKYTSNGSSWMFVPLETYLCKKLINVRTTITRKQNLIPFSLPFSWTCILANKYTYIIMKVYVPIAVSRQTLTLNWWRHFEWCHSGLFGLLYLFACRLWYLGGAKRKKLRQHTLRLVKGLHQKVQVITLRTGH